MMQFFPPYVSHSPPLDLYLLSLSPSPSLSHFFTPPLLVSLHPRPLSGLSALSSKASKTLESLVTAAGGAGAQGGPSSPRQTPQIPNKPSSPISLPENLIPLKRVAAQRTQDYVVGPSVVNVIPTDRECFGWIGAGRVV